MSELRGQEKPRVIDTMPDDLLSVIFAQCQPQKADAYPGESQGPAPEWRAGDEWHVDLGGASVKDYYFSWMAVTQVCQRWREVALANPSLWTSIHLEPSFKCPGTLATVFLARSYPIPIQLHHELEEVDEEEESEDEEEEEEGHDTAISQPDEHKKNEAEVATPPISQEDEYLDAFYDSLIQHPDRVASLDLGAAFHPKMKKLVNLPMPNLVTVRLRTGNQMIFSEFPSEEYWVDHSSNFLSFSGETAANIRQLSLCNYFFPLQGFTSLTHLYLAYEQPSPTGYVSHDDFLEFLKGVSPTLTVLCIADAGPDIQKPSDFTPHKGREAIHMPSLQYVEVSSVVGYSFYPLFFLHYLTFPDTVKFAWTHYPGNDDDESPERLDEDRIFYLPPPQCLDRITAVIVRGEPEPHFIVKDYAVRIGCQVVNNASTTLEFQRYLTAVRVLMVQGDAVGWVQGAEEGRARNLLGFQSVAILHIRSSSILLPAIIRLLDSGTTDANEGDPSIGPVWPNLSTIVIYPDIGNSRHQALQDQLGLQLSDSAIIPRSRTGGQSYNFKVETRNVDFLTSDSFWGPFE